MDAHTRGCWHTNITGSGSTQWGPPHKCWAWNLLLGPQLPLPTIHMPQPHSTHSHTHTPSQSLNPAAAQDGLHCLPQDVPPCVWQPPTAACTSAHSSGSTQPPHLQPFPGGPKAPGGPAQ